ncbi:hypothetical protein QQF64_007606 [Cirrhinus molitorella]|uniref:Uncharacterized protein n=1 Tax=Cirrhinus molitorella TaxID=172907 RepID=A0ABR3MB92_9TELE
MSSQDAMQRHCQEAIQGIFTTGEIRTGWATTKDTCDPVEKDGLTWTITLVVGLSVRSGCVNSTLAV